MINKTISTLPYQEYAFEFMFPKNVSIEAILNHIQQTSSVFQQSIDKENSKNRSASFCLLLKPDPYLDIWIEGRISKA